MTEPSVMRKLRVPAADDLRFRSFAQRTGRTYTHVLLEGARAYVGQAETESDFVWSLINALADDPADKPTVTFRVSRDGSVAIDITPKGMIPLHQLAEAATRPLESGQQTLELRAHEFDPDHGGTVLPVCIIPPAVDLTVTVQLQDLDPNLATPTP